MISLNIPFFTSFIVNTFLVTNVPFSNLIGKETYISSLTELFWLPFTTNEYNESSKLSFEFQSFSILIIDWLKVNTPLRFNFSLIIFSF